MNILLFGPPGCGKGTQAEKLVAKYGLTHVSTGDVFRQLMRNKSPLAEEVRSYIDKGQLVPDQVVLKVIEEKLKTLPSMILDGFPRTEVQAKALAEILNEQGKKLDAVLFLDVPTEEIVDRLKGRRVCKGCGVSWHVKNHPSKQEGVCDKCNSALEQRKDDKEETIRERLEVYKRQTQPLYEYYQSQGLLVEIQGQGKPEIIFERMTKHLNRRVDLKEEQC